MKTVVNKLESLGYPILPSDPMSVCRHWIPGTGTSHYSIWHYNYLCTKG